jgi:membrane protein EpsK
MRHVTSEALLKISSVGKWLLVNHVGSVLFLYTDLWVINFFFGAERAGEYSLGVQWSNMIRQIALVVTSLFAPVLLIQYSRQLYRSMRKGALTAVGICGVFLAIVVGVVAGLSAPLLRLWVGEEFMELSVILCALILPLALNLSVSPLFAVNTAHNKVKTPALVTLIAGVAALASMVIAIKLWAFNVVGVALISAVILTIKNIIFIPLYTAKIADIYAAAIFNRLLRTFLCLLAVFCCSYSTQLLVPIEDFFQLSVTGLTLSLVSGVFAFCFILYSDEKALLRKLFWV